MREKKKTQQDAVTNSLKMKKFSITEPNLS